MNLNDLLVKKGLDPEQVLVMRHSPHEPNLKKVLPWVASTKPSWFNAYQQTQYKRQEDQVKRAKYLASFIGHGSGKALYIGLYEIGGSRVLPREEFWEIPANQELGKLGMTGWPSNDKRKSCLLFDLRITDAYKEWKGKLVVSWPSPARVWCRWAHKNEFLVAAILEENALEEHMPPWYELVLPYEMLRNLWPSWQAALSQWRAIYFIFDVSDGEGYVGAAYGKQNLLSRWLNYAATGHGGNKKLKGRDSRNLRFSILQRVSPDMDKDDVARLEATWKDRLHTRECGLNEN
jgi:hypothetical protein